VELTDQRHAADSNGRTIWIADAHRDRKRFVVRADEMLTAFVELEAGDARFPLCRLTSRLEKGGCSSEP
jgi:hypothetical protein